MENKGGDVKDLELMPAMIRLAETAERNAAMCLDAWRALEGCMRRCEDLSGQLIGVRAERDALRKELNGSRA